MKIQEKNSISGLKNIISRLFDVNFDTFELSKYHQDLPLALKELYEIEAFMAKHNCSFETIRFFSNIDRLVPYQSLNFTEDFFVFLHENQHNWQCKTKLNSDEVFYEDKVEPQNSKTLKPKLADFLTTFALQEMAFSMQFYIGLESENMDEIRANFNKIEAIWVEKDYIYTQPSSFYLIDDDCFVMYAGMNIFATNNETKFNYYKNILQHYNF
jgi:hypothetical protein